MGARFNFISLSTIYEYSHFETVLRHYLFMVLLYIMRAKSNWEDVLILHMGSMEQSCLTITWQTVICLSCSWDK